MNPRNPVFSGIAAIALALLPSCSITQKSGAGLAAYQSYDRPAKLPADPANVTVKVSLGRQRAYVIEGSEVLMVMPISVGAPGSSTPTGNFRIFNKVERKRRADHGYAYHGGSSKLTGIRQKPPGWKFSGTPLPYWCEFKPGVAFHTGWIRHYPCSDGCIRMHENLAPKFFRMVRVGTPVTIAYSQAEDATHGKIPLPPDAGPLPDYDVGTYTGDGYFSRHKAPVFE